MDVDAEEGVDKENFRSTTPQEEDKAECSWTMFVKLLNTT